MNDLEEYSADFVTGYAPEWEAWFQPWRGKPGLRILEIGSFEGRSARWFLDNLCTDPDATVTCVDIFAHQDYEKRFDHNISLSPRAHQVIKHKGASQPWLLQFQEPAYDLIYVDGSHEASDVLMDGLLAWRVLKEGGRLLFDDYLWACHIKGPLQRPQLAIDLLLDTRPLGMQLLHRDRQVLLAKQAPVRHCLRSFPSPEPLRAFYEDLPTRDPLPIQMEIYRRLLRPGDTAIDGGANRAIHTRQMALQVWPGGRVLAFEPQFPLAVAMRTKLEFELPGLKGIVELQAAALSSQSGRATFHEAPDPAYSSLRSRPQVETLRTREVPLVRLDDLVISGPLRLIKLDLEGGEFDAMRGGRELIQQHRPVLVFEYDHHRSPLDYGFAHEEMLDFLKDLDYQLIDIVGTDFQPRELWREAWLADYVALPGDAESRARVLSAIECVLGQYS